ncbi:MAG: IS1634 family transposase [Planctomycetota bacterium]|nr:IS1634 family transposase [Planctomycetota bacterium]
MKRSNRRAHQAPDPATFAPQATGGDLTLHTRCIGVLPILNRLIQRCQLRETLWQFLPSEDRRQRIDTATAILLLVRNILVSREPLYGIGQWSAAFVPELLNLRQDQLRSLNDDRVGRALDRLFDVNFPEFVMAVTQHAVAEFQLDLSELHNDSTTVKFYGDYAEFDQPQRRRGKTTAAIRHGHSKDHRPDLKQLLYILTVTDDGGVPVYFTTDNGDQHDDKTHVPTWNLLRELTGRSDFLYVADCKLASAANLSHIDREGGRFITILPKNRSEPKRMKEKLRDDPDSLRWELLYEVVDEDDVLRQRFKTLREEQLTADGYRLLWIHSLAKAVSDDEGRVKAIQKTTDELTALRKRLQSPRSRMPDRRRVDTEIDTILQRRDMSELFNVEVLPEEQVTLVQTTRGRKSADTQYTRVVKLRFDLTWQVNVESLQRARRGDGVFPLITNDRQLTAEAVLRAYKRQPIIEKRFSQLKTDFNVAPVYLKEVSRIESLLCVYFLALLLQTLLERELRGAMAKSKLETLPLYSEGRACSRPTARRVIDVMESMSRHRLQTNEGVSLDLYTDATPIQRQLIELFGMHPSTYGRR